MKHFEYMRLFFDARWRDGHTDHHLLQVFGVNDDPLEHERDLIGYLNELGKQGWEVVGIIRDNHLLLKREVS